MECGRHERRIPNRKGRVMATHTQRVEHIERRVWAVPVPSNHAEVSKALRAATAAAYVDNGGKNAPDDQVVVEADDTEIRFVITTGVTNPQVGDE